MIMNPIYQYEKLTIDHKSGNRTEPSSWKNRPVPQERRPLAIVRENPSKLSLSVVDVKDQPQCWKDFDRIKCSKSIFNNCERPREKPISEADRVDFATQVTHEDIQSAIQVQTTASLLDRGAELPKRNPYFLQNKAARKCPNCFDCQAKPYLATGRPLEADTQTEPWWVGWPEHVQIGPSFTALGPFCRLDYKLKKTKQVKDESYFDCCRKEEPPDGAISSSERGACYDFQQQVNALNINITEELVTEELSKTGELRGCVMYASWPKAFSRAIYKNGAQFESDGPFISENDDVKIYSSFVMQVSQLDICLSKYTQTDICLMPCNCWKSGKYKTSNSACEFGSHVNSVSRKGPRTFQEFGQQVQAGDIKNAEEIQTGSSLATMKPFKVTSTENLSGTVKNMARAIGNKDRTKDQCDCMNTASDIVNTSEIYTQAGYKNMGVNKEVQTNEEDPKIKYFIRRQQWVNRTWQ